MPLRAKNWRKLPNFQWSAPVVSITAPESRTSGGAGWGGFWILPEWVRMALVYFALLHSRVLIGMPAIGKRISVKPPKAEVARRRWHFR